MMQTQRVDLEVAHAAERRVIGLADATDGARAGAKAATLALLLKRGHLVPDGFVVPVGADPADPDWRKTIERGLRELGDGPVAVRSSAVAEDGDGASFAGQLSSFLDVRGIDAVLGAVARCIASGESARVAAYRQTLAFGADRGVAVLVQRLVPAEVAGVAFGVNPTSGDDEVLLSAVHGLGDRLVGGQVEGESWAVADAPRPLVEPRILTAELATRVAELTRRLGQELGAPQDVEWALFDGELFVLQSRPISAVPVEPDFTGDPTEGVWFRDEVHVTSTLTAFAADTYMPAVMRGMSAVGQEVGLMFDGLQSHWRSGDWYGRVIPPGGKDGPAPPWWFLGIVSRLLPSMRAKNRAARRALESSYLDDVVHDWTSGGRARFDAEVRDLHAIDLPSLDDSALLGHLDRVLDLMDRGQMIHFRLFMPWMLHVHRFVVTCRELLGWQDERILSLLAGSSQTSTAPGRELGELARRLREMADPSAVAAAGDPIAALREVDATLAAEAEAWLERWGLRAAAYDPGSPTLAEQPGLLLDLLREGLARADALEVSNNAVLAEAHAGLASRPGDRTRFDEALAAARRVFPIREDNVLYTDNLVNGLARLAAMEIGRRLVGRRELERREDAVELHHAELRRALRGELEESAALARRRRLERAWVAAHPGPAMLCGEQAPPPDMRALPRPLRTLNVPFMWIMGLEYPKLTGAAAAHDDDDLHGIGAWPGRYTGIARVVRDEGDLSRVRQGDVLVAPITTPAWSVVFPRLGALVTNAGGLLSHAAIVAREHGIPTVLATERATTRLRDGQRVTVDGSRGVVKVAP